MFTRQGNQEFCSIHPDVRATLGIVKLKGKLRSIKTCAKCDELVNELRQTKSTNERFSS